MVKMITKIDEQGLSEAAVSSKRAARSMLKWEREKKETKKQTNTQTFKQANKNKTHQHNKR